MQVLVADDELTSRVMVETALRERGHTVRNCDDGFEAAKILSSPYAPRIALISNTLFRLRGLDVCRFLCATGKKTGVYVILLTDSMDMELVELCRRAGVDDIIPRNITAAGLHYRLDVATRVVELETEIKRIQGVLQGLASFESPLDKKAKVLRDANAALLDSAKKKNEPAAVPGAEKKPSVATDQNAAKAYRGIQVAPEKVQKPEPDESLVRNLLSPEPEFKTKPKEPNYDAILYRPVERPTKPLVPSREAEPEMSPEEIASAVQQAAASSAAPQTPTHDDAHQTVLAGAEQLQNEELASDELIHPFEFDDLILNVFSGMGVTLKTELPPKAVPEGPVFISWVGVLMTTTPSWLDVILISGEAGAKAVTKELLGQSKVVDSDVTEMFAELQNMVQGSLRRYLEENGHKSVLQLSIPRAVKLEKLPEIPASLLPLVESGFSIGGEPIGVKLFEHREFVTYENVMDLHCFDLICDPVQKVGSDSNLLIQGAIVRTKEKAVVEGVTGSVKPYRVLHVSPLLQAIGAKQMLEVPGGNCA
jgi:CheY-like chemotaxis protein